MKRKLLQWALFVTASVCTSNVFGQLSGFYQQDFEGPFPPNGWRRVDVLDPDNIWQKSTADHYSGTHSANINYTNFVQGEDWLILPHFTAGTNDSISFWLAADYVGYPPDSTVILVSTTDSNVSSFTTVIAILHDDTVGTSTYPPVQDVFQYYAYSLSDFAGQDIYVAFRNRNNYGDGVFIDLVSIGTTPPVLSVAAVSADVPDYLSLNTVSPMGTVKNNSDADQTFPVTMTITGGYSSTMDVTNLAPGATQQITFDPWTPVAGGATVTMETQLATDTISSDNTVTKNVTAFDLEPFVNFGWTPKAVTASTVWDPAVASVNNPDGTSLLYVLAGVNGGFIIPDTKQYNPEADSWTLLNPVTTGVYTASAAAINDKIYLIGGYNPAAIGDNQVYDLATNTWSSGTAMPTAVGDYAFGVYHDSLLYYIGGFDGATDQDLVQIYDPGTDSWTSGTAIPMAASGWRGGIVGNKIVVVGGYSQTLASALAGTYVGTIDASDPSVITWVQADDYPTGTISRLGGGASIDPASGLVIFTGGDPAGDGITASDGTFAYDVNSNTWKIGPVKPTAAHNLCNLVCATYNDSLYLVTVGGYNNGELKVNEWLNLGPSPFATSITESNPADFVLSSYPNPFSKFTSIYFSLDQSSAVKISIVDVTGKEVKELCNKTLPAGAQQMTWNASGYSAGVYFCKVIVNGNVTTQKLVKLN